MSPSNVTVSSLRIKAEFFLNSRNLYSFDSGSVLQLLFAFIQLVIIMSNNQTNSTDRDVIQTLRTAHQNQTQLNLMADQKANILIGTLVLMYTVVFTRILTLAEYSDQVMVPLASFIVLEIIPMVLTILVLIPRNIKGKSEISIDEMPNPLFFGFFTKFSEKEYC